MSKKLIPILLILLLISCAVCCGLLTRSDAPPVLASLTDTLDNWKMQKVFTMHAARFTDEQGASITVFECPDGASDFFSPHISEAGHVTIGFVGDFPGISYYYKSNNYLHWSPKGGPTFVIEYNQHKTSEESLNQIMHLLNQSLD